MILTNRRNPARDKLSLGIRGSLYENEDADQRRHVQWRRSFSRALYESATCAKLQNRLYNGSPTERLKHVPVTRKINNSR